MSSTSDAVVVRHAAAWAGADGRPQAGDAAAGAGPDPSRHDAALRALDLLLASLPALLLALPALALLGWARWAPGRAPRWQDRACQGRAGRQFLQGSLGLPASLAGRCLGRLGASHWPLLLNILRGEMAWVGPRARGLHEAVPAATLAVRPGLVNPGFLRRRTALALGDEAGCDAGYLAGRSLRQDLGLLLRGSLLALLPPPALALPGRVQVGDVMFHNIDLAQALARIDAMLSGPGACQVAFVNPACVNIAARHRGYRRALARADLVLPDGIGIKIGSDLLGTPLKQNVNGTDLYPHLCALLQARGARVFLLGGRPGVAQAVADQIARCWPGLRVAGLRDGYFGVADEGSVAAQVRASGADLLLVARGVPSQDLFIARHLPLLGVKVAMGVGGLFDFASGRIPRAPLWMRESGLEWVHRLLQEPGRLWRRYLLGNLGFLARVGLQRLGLRRPAPDRLPLGIPADAGRGPDSAVPGAGRAPTVVLLATRLAGPDLPVEADLPAALLPLGCASAAERVLAQLAGAGVRELHLVVSDQPEQLRRVLGDGCRWGLRLHWHWVADPQRPYGLLRRLARQDGPGGRLLIGHADRLLAPALLARLLQADAVVVPGDAPAGLRWCAWASLPAAQAARLPAGLDEAALAAALLAGDADAGRLPARLVAGPADCPALHSARAYLAAQFPPAPAHADALAGNGLVADVALPAVPEAWIRMPWGAMSPRAVLHPTARVLGPALIGPGCVVGRGALIGPQVLLSRDVVVGAGTQVSHSVVMPRSYLAAQLTVTHSIVNGPQLRQVPLGVGTRLAPQDALLLSLDARGPAGPSWAGRALAGLLWGLAAPWARLALRARARRGRPLPWRQRPVVVGPAAGGHGLHTRVLSQARADAGRVGQWLAHWQALAEVARGHRCWRGARPRSRAEWRALRPAWQDLLAGAPLGLLHARAWVEPAAGLAEAQAAADALQHAAGRGRAMQWARQAA